MIKECKTPAKPRFWSSVQRLSGRYKPAVNVVWYFLCLVLFLIPLKQLLGPWLKFLPECSCLQKHWLSDMIGFSRCRTVIPQLCLFVTQCWTEYSSMRLQIIVLNYAHCCTSTRFHCKIWFRHTTEDDKCVEQRPYPVQKHHSNGFKIIQLRKKYWILADSYLVSTEIDPPGWSVYSNTLAIWT